MSGTCVACKEPNDTDGLQCSRCQTRPRGEPRFAAPRAPAPTAPEPRRIAAGVVELVIPWTGLVADNQNRGVAGEDSREKRSAFKLGVARFRQVVQEQYSGPPTPGPVRVDVAVYVPDDRVRDAPNWWKAIGDGLKGLVITDDRWQVLRKHAMEVVGIDPDRPRAEITIRELAGVTSTDRASR